MPGSPLFTPQAIAALRRAQTDTMPHLCYVLARTLTREPGAVTRQGWAVARSFACRVSGMQAGERLDDTRRQEQIVASLSYPVTEAPLDGTELVIVVGDGTHGDRAFVHLYRVAGARAEKSFETRRVAGLTDVDVPRDVDPMDYLP
jgi:hypothetical protein